MEAALRVRQAAQDQQEAFREIRSWESSISKSKPASSQAGSGQLPPIRNRGTLAFEASSQDAVGSDGKKEAAKQRIKSFEYDKWDKFDVDKALVDVDYQPSHPSSSKSSANTNSGSSDKPLSAQDIEDALVEKEKGNEYYKRCNYEKAVKCYTKSYNLNRTDVTPLVNRAMTYIKLKKWALAESDCTTALSVHPKHVKALYRRSIARRELGHLESSLQDLETALVLEPGNASVKEELDAVKKMMKGDTKGSESAPKPSKEPTPKPRDVAIAAEPPKLPLSNTHPQRRRVKIQEVSDAEFGHPFICNEKQDPVKENPKPSAPVAKVAELKTASPPIEPKPVPPSETKQTRPEIMSVKETGSSLSRQATPPIPSVPQTMFDFERDWKSFGGHLESMYKYFRAIPPQQLPSLFRSSIESHHVSSIIHILHNFYIPNELGRMIFDTMDWLSKVPRFNTMLLFLSRTDKQYLEKVVAHVESMVGHQKMDGITMSHMQDLKKSYKIK